MVRNRLEEMGQEESRLGRVSTRKRVPLRSLAGKGNFTPTLAISKYLRAPLGKKYIFPCVTDSYGGIQILSVSP